MLEPSPGPQYKMLDIVTHLCRPRGKGGSRQSGLRHRELHSDWMLDTADYDGDDPPAPRCRLLGQRRALLWPVECSAVGPGSSARSCGCSVVQRFPLGRELRRIERRSLSQ
ncbi:Hypothetical protein SMAX5B_012517 [Scophthalmus maximus]|uniref:Uncharacterized protein n=1 Tax=Scophthalmus maximus TaxID=52904 RepID=A0A2U9BC14_SCOMX|nr:Hypothetical protein SMAX5B_012517 [Scophthalmus maximus]